MSEKQIFLVVSGEYSDRRVDGVFDDRELAKLFMAKYSKNSGQRGWHIETWPVNPQKAELTAGLLGWNVWIQTNGDASAHPRPALVDSGHRLSRSAHGRIFMRADVFAKNKQHAVKIANEMRTQLIATGQWKVDD